MFLLCLNPSNGFSFHLKSLNSLPILIRMHKICSSLSLRLYLNAPLSNLPLSPFCSLNAPSSFASCKPFCLGRSSPGSSSFFRYQQKCPPPCLVSALVLFYTQYMSPIDIFLFICMSFLTRWNSSSTRVGVLSVLFFAVVSRV